MAIGVNLMARGYIGKGWKDTVPIVGAALIKKYSSYRTYPKKFHVFFSQNWFAGT